MGIDRFIAIGSVAAAIFAAIPAWLPYVSNIELGSIFEAPAVRVLSVVFSALLIFIAGWNSHKVFQAWKRPSFEENLKRRTQIKEENARTLNRLDGDFRVMLFTAYRKGAVYSEADRWSNFVLYHEDYYSQFLEWKNLADGRVEIKPSKSFVDICRSDPDLFDDITEETISAYARKKNGVRRIDGYSSSGLPFWWY